MKAPKKNLISAALLVAPVFASALGLGGINVKSGLNQPLEAEIPVTVNSQAESDSLSVMLANADDYARVGIDARGLQVPLEFKVVKDARGQTVIRVTSQQSIREPFLQLLLQVNWNSGKLLREYSVLIDPPMMAPALRGSQATSIPVKEPAPAMPVESTMPKPAEPPPVMEAKPAAQAKPMAETKPMAEPKPMEPEPVTPKPAADPKPMEADGADTVTTKAGDSLYVIANQNRVGGANIEQMMISILRMNPQAFSQGNINMMKKGQILRMPSADDVNKITLSEAAKVVREQNALWRGYRNEAAARPAAIADPGAGSVSMPAAQSNNSAQLRLVPPANASGDARALTAAQAEAARSKEGELSARKAETEMRNRVSELERLKADQERLLTMKNDEIARLGKELELARKNAEAAATAVVPASVDSPVDPVEETKPVETVVSNETKPVDAPVDETKPDEVKPDDIWQSEENKPVDAAVTPVDSATLEPDPNATPADGTTVEPVSEPTVTEATPEPVIEPTPDPAIVATEDPVIEAKPWYMNPIAWGAGALGLAGLLGFALTRKKKPAIIASAPSGFGDVNFGIPAIGAGAGVADAFSVDNSHDEDEMRIRGAISANPQDLWAHLDLLRLYYSRQDSQSFEAAASTMFGYVVDTDAPQWQEARTMGMQLIPGSALFAASAFEAPAFVAPSFQTPPVKAPVIKDEPIGSLDLASFNDDRSGLINARAGVPASTDFAFEMNLDGATQVVQPIKGEQAKAKDDFNFDFSFDAPTKAPELAPAPVLKMDDARLSEVIPAELEASGEASLDDFMIGEDSVSTKLDLARAYLDMGDPDGARSMLEEVLAEGNDSQKADAKQLMGRIA
jgi:pilus assembly protein FimV